MEDDSIMVPEHDVMLDEPRQDKKHQSMLEPETSHRAQKLSKH